MPNRSYPVILRGARENNLKGLNLEVHPGEILVITGLSGTGKSTLLFDVLHAEGQRRYMETFSPYVRQFLETLPRPKIDSMSNARPSIAVEQHHSIRNSRSTVGTMTEICDYFKVWFPKVAQLHDPDDNDAILDDETPLTQANSCISTFKNRKMAVGFWIDRGQLSCKDFLHFLLSAGHGRILAGNKFLRIEDLLKSNWRDDSAFVVIDRLEVMPDKKERLVEAINLSLELGKGLAEARSTDGKLLKLFHLGLRSRKSGREFKPLGPNSFSFNSAVGACPNCKGFGKTIEICSDLVIPDHSLSINQGAIKPFEGKVYGHCLNELLQVCSLHGIDPQIPWKELSEKNRRYIWEGDPQHCEGDDKWYGIHSFFKWLEKKAYKMHVRVFLSKYRGYFKCHDCHGGRFRRESEWWKWRGHSLSDLYALPISELLPLLESFRSDFKKKQDLSFEAILARLRYLQEVGLDYLTLDRPSRTLSGGESQRINLTACLGAGLTDTLFALDEPTVGLHHKDVSRLVGVLRNLADAGNCVCVVEHDEQVILAADRILEIGPEPGSGGGEITFHGSVPQILRSSKSPTGKWLSRKTRLQRLNSTESSQCDDWIRIRGADVHNLNKFSADLPLGKFACIAGLSGSGKSTLLHNLLFEELSKVSTRRWVDCDVEFSEIVMMDQNSIGRSSRSNAVLYCDAWSPIKEAFGRTAEASRMGFTSSDFSFNSGNGRCESCMGLGFETVEMQFLPDVSIPCPVCEGRRFKDELLEVRLDGLNAAEVLDLNVSAACDRFVHLPKTNRNLSILKDLGLGYLKLGQPLTTLSGGESQRLKLAKFMGPAQKRSRPALLLLDEPTTGLHLADVDRLIECLRKVTMRGHSLYVIEHHPSVLGQSDWIVELGPGAGKMGGRIVAQGSPRSFLSLKTPTADLLNEFVALSSRGNGAPNRVKGGIRAKAFDLEVIGAKENNLRNVSIAVPANQFVVVTGPSGSGKSSLAFDVVFAEGQRRFLESMSSYARQFVEQLGKPDVDQMRGIRPTVAVAQRVTRGSRKSTVGSITEVAQYLRLLYARIGEQRSPINGKPLVSSTPHQISLSLAKHLDDFAGGRLLSPLVSNRKGHHKPLINWARDRGFKEVRCDGDFLSTESFPGLDRHRSHDVEVVMETWSRQPLKSALLEQIFRALEIGNGRCLALSSKGKEFWFSTRKVDPTTGEAYPDLEPALLSWNSPRGWCSFCRGYGRIFDWMKDDLPASGDWWNLQDGDVCPSCKGQRLAEVGRNVYLNSKDSPCLSLPELLSLSSVEVIRFLRSIQVTKAQRPIVEIILPEVLERLSFMGEVGLDYLSLDRETSSLSGGESQRIRLAGQLGSNLSGVLYVLDEPSIGLHASDNQKLINALRRLQSNGNSLLVVEHDHDTISQADCIIEIGPQAGTKGGRVVAAGKPGVISKKARCSTGKYLKSGILHPIRESWRALPNKKHSYEGFLCLSKVRFRNLRNLRLRIPFSRLVVCCGVSGSGKSSLVRGALFQAVKQAIRDNAPFVKTARCELRNGDGFAKAIEVSQSPIGKTPRSTPATYLGVWTRIRELISSLPEAKARGLSPSDFSFNVKGGRCENCKGAGRIKVEMNFLPDSFVSCEECGGKRYQERILELKWRGKNIAEILDLTFEEAERFFSFDKALQATFELMNETGLSYVRLGQLSPSLSGGEAQRLKLASELAVGIDSRLSSGQSSKKNFYVLEEPTIGLHAEDCLRLLKLLHRLVDEGHTVLVIEHDLELIAEADHLIELGPRGGKDGGLLLHQGSVLELLNRANTPTSKFLRRKIKFR